MIRAEGLSLGRKGRSILKDVSVEIPAGAITVAVGPNGAGKSSLLKCLSGEWTPDAGRVTYGADPLGGIPLRRLARLRAVVPQASAPAFSLTVHELVRLGAQAAGSRNPDVATAAALAAAGLDGWGDRTVVDLSGGERQRVHFARALAQVPMPRDTDGPRALLLDEPTSNLDLAQQIALLEKARSFARRGGAVFAVLHDLNLAAEFADRIVVLADGRSMVEGPPSRPLFERIAEEVYGLGGAASRMPENGVPFVLPQSRFRPGRPSP